MTELVVCPVRSALRGCAVVGDENDDRVLQFPLGLQVVQHTADLVIGMADEGGEDLHHPRVQPAAVLVELLPVGNPVGAFRQLYVLTDDPARLLLRQPLRTPCVPTGVETAPVALEPFGGRLMWGVRCGGGVPHEERAVGMRQA